MKKQWKQFNNIYNLYITPFNDELLVAQMEYDEDGGWYKVGMIITLNDYFEGNLEQVKEFVENDFINNLNDDIDYIKEKIKCIESEK